MSDGGVLAGSCDDEPVEGVGAQRGELVETVGALRVRVGPPLHAGEVGGLLLGEGPVAGLLAGAAAVGLVAQRLLLDDGRGAQA